MFTYYNNVREVLEMNVYTTEKIRNVVLLGHSGCGKTSLVEAMAYLAGQTTRMGTVADGSTISDFDKEEIKRQFSIHTSVVPIEWDNVKINILDTPGFFDFVGEVEEAVSAADAAIIVVSGKAGIQTGTKRAWEICEKYKLPRMIFVTDMDIDNASFKDVVLKLQELYGKKIAPFHLPIRENEKFVGYVNVIQQRAKRWNESGGVDKFDVEKFGCEWAYTMDGGEVGELEFENFNAASAKVVVKGRNVHPGYAKNKMINSMCVANQFMNLLPDGETPQCTENYEGFYHLVGITGEVEQTTLSYIIRDHDRAKFEARKENMLKWAAEINKKYGEETVTVELKDQYYNMREKIEPVMHIIDIAFKAMEEAGVTPKVKAIRGGTDGAQLSFKGLPCPNIFAGGLNFHGRYEFAPIQSLEKAMMVVVKISELVAR